MAFAGAHIIKPFPVTLLSLSITELCVAHSEGYKRKSNVSTVFWARKLK